MDLEVTENKQEININKEDVQSAIFRNFENNRRITNEMQQKVYERVNEKINALLRNDGEIQMDNNKELVLEFRKLMLLIIQKRQQN